jgi:hypothetical protein
MVPVVSAEWNHNLFNPPYLTVAGTGAGLSKSLTSGSVSDVTVGAKPNFTTKSFTMSAGKGSVKYTASSANSPAYKIITYVKTNDPTPIMVTASGKGTGLQYGSEAVEADSLGWTKVITYVGSNSASNPITSLVYTLSANSLSFDEINATVYFTEPEIYPTTFFDYQNHSLFPTESVFTYFRSGESYVQSGDSKFSFPSSYRKINSSLLSGYSAATYSPINSIVQNPKFFLASPPIPVLKNALPSDIAPYKYFVSDKDSKSVTAIYEKNITTNKIVIKFNTLMTIPSVNISLNGSMLTVDGSQTITPPSNSDGKCVGILTLYWTGSAWTKTKWSTMPKFNDAGALSLTTSFSKITVTQVSKTTNQEFSSYTGDDVLSDLGRMHIIEISPRLEIDLTDFVENVSINKSLDGDNTVLPISSLNTNDATINLSGIPAMNGSTIVPIFSSQSDQSSTVLANMLRKNIKFYINFNLVNYTSIGTSPVTSNTYIPGGVFYSDSWNENDIQSVSVQCFDVSRYLQSTPVPDYVANLKSVFEIITNILDLSGFTDYDYDSLYSVCNNKNAPLDFSYYYCNSKDSTIVDSLNQIFLAYQIGAYVDEYGVMKFLSLQNILSSSTSNLSISESNIVQGGLSVSNNAKPGKISLRYQSPKVKQSPSLQNVKDLEVKNSPSFIYTTSNSVVWSQESVDSVGFNYLDIDMDDDDNEFTINVNDLLDVFHTFNLNNSGYAFIDNEIVSFVYKEYVISKVDDSSPVLVSVKNNIELASEINKYIKKYSIGLKTSDGTTKQDYDYDVKVEPTGAITNVERGLFGTVPLDHKRISTLESKDLTEITLRSSTIISGTENYTIVDNNNIDSSLPSLKKITLSSVDEDKTMMFSSTEIDTGYKTYSVKFDMYPDQDVCAAGLFFNMESASSSAGTHFIELVRYNKMNTLTLLPYSPPQYKYLLVIHDVDQNCHAWADVSGQCNNIVNNFPKIIKKTIVDNKPEYSYVTDDAFHLKMVHWTSDGTDGETGTEVLPRTVISVFLNNVEITGWQIPGEFYDEETNPSGSGWKATETNPKTGMRQKPTIVDIDPTGTKFGFYATLSPGTILGLNPQIIYPQITSPYSASLREIHATKKPLKDRSVNYFYQDTEFLNGLIQSQPLYTNSPTYLMQTTPEVSGINYYDVQYSTPAAVSVDVLPIEYMMRYFPGNEKEDQTNYQKKLVDEYSLAYSTPINTGFRARMAIANGSPHMVFLTREADEINNVTISLNLWTHEIIAPSEPEIIERVIDPANASEVVQLDSEWIQSKQAAQKMLKVIQMGLEGFSKNISLDIFGNPLIQIGDIVLLSYSLNGISQQKYLVHSVSHSFREGLETSLQLKRIQE